MKQLFSSPRRLLILFLFAGLSTTPASLGRTLRFPKVLLPVPAAFDSKAADLNGDGNIDLAILPDSGLYVLLGDGNGNFSEPAVYNEGGFQTVLALGDFNGDGFPDAAVANFPGINVLLNDGAGGFPVSTFINTGAEPSGLAVADFDGDGNLDLAVSDFQSSSISILKGDGNGGFAPPIIFATGTNPARIVAGDFDGDGVPDLAAAEYGSMDLRIFTGLGDGHFSAGAIYSLGGNAQSVVTADFNNDGNLDLAANVFNIFPNDHIAVFIGDGDGGFAQSASLPGSDFLGLAATDFDGDGNADVIYLDSPYLDIALGNGSGGFSAPRQVSLLSATDYTITAADFNDDGRIDLFTSPGTGVLLFQPPSDAAK